MTNLPKSTSLMSKVIFRMRVLSLGLTALISFLVGTCIYLVAFLVQRLTGLYPDVFDPATLAFVPAFAVLGAVLFHRRPQRMNAARKIDERSGSKDLFLTV